MLLIKWTWMKCKRYFSTDNQCAERLSGYIEICTPSWRQMRWDKNNSSKAPFFSCFFFIKNSMLAYMVICCSHQSDRGIRVRISHWSDCRIRVCISHQSYHSIWISCTNHSVWVLFSCKWCHGSKNDINQKLWAHLISVMVWSLARALSIMVEIYWDRKGMHLKFLS